MPLLMLMVLGFEIARKVLRADTNLFGGGPPWPPVALAG